MTKEQQEAGEKFVAWLVERLEANREYVSSEDAEWLTVMESTTAKMKLSLETTKIDLTEDEDLCLAGAIKEYVLEVLNAEG